MQFTLKAAKQAAALAILALVLVLGSAYWGAKTALQYTQHSQPGAMKFYQIDWPPRPCPGC